MESTGKVRIFRADDREKVAGILSANGYAVWQGKEKEKKSIAYFIYFEDRKGVQNDES